ncbi:MAG: hypothetical protein KKE31_03500 [Planctomycetes bacterium]|nr:hypothetical protein [Planctomycetota bacterium]MBU1517362.1 hypothetical protein [Planctomycetota bacterium]MBU2457679.1 hypothetical protein [Planctomycetota bacterium]
MNKLRSWLVIVVFAIGAALGVVSIIIPPLWIVDVKADESPIFPMVWTGIEGMSGWTLFFLFLSGMFLGVIYPKREPLYGRFLGVIYPKYELLWGISTMSLLPILAFIEMSAVPNSHNVWPIEFVIYGFCTIPGIIGAYIGAFIRKKLIPNRQ